MQALPQALEMLTLVTEGSLQKMTGVQAAVLHPPCAATVKSNRSSWRVPGATKKCTNFVASLALMLQSNQVQPAPQSDNVRRYRLISVVIMHVCLV